MTNIKITSRISLSEFIQFSLLSFFKSKQTVLLLISLVAISTISMIGIMPFLFIYVSVLIVLTVPVYLVFKASKTYKAAEILNQEITYVFGEEALELKASFLDKKIKYTNLLKIVWRKDFVMVYLDERLALFVNQKNIQASNQSQELKELIDKISK